METQTENNQTEKQSDVLEGNTETELEKALKLLLIEELELDANASGMDILHAVRNIHGIAKAANKSIPASEVATVLNEFNSYRSSIESQSTEDKVKSAMRRGILPPALKDWGLSLCKSNPAAFDEFISNTPVHELAINHEEQFNDLEKHNITGGVTPDAEQIASQLGIEPDKLK